MSTKRVKTGRAPSADDEIELPLGPALDFMRRLWALNHALELVSSHMVRTLGITAQQRLIIRCVGKYPGLTPSQLADLLHLDRGTVSTALARLESRGLLQRRRDPRDRRRVSLGLTGDGRALDLPTDGTVERAVERLLDGLDAAALEAALIVLDTLTSKLSQEAQVQRQAT